MPTVQVDTLAFDFPDAWRVSKLDEWSYFRNQFGKLGHGVRLTCSRCRQELHCAQCGTVKNAGVKACDLIAVQGKSTWLIEVKDYRQAIRTKAIDMADEVALKLRDSLSILLAAAYQANDDNQRQFANSFCRGSTLRVIVHLEQNQVVSRLRPRAIDPTQVAQRLRRLIKAIDPHPLVVDSVKMSNLPWSVQPL